MTVNTGFETNVDFTQVTGYSPSDLEDLGEAGIINNSLEFLFGDKTYEENDRLYKVDRFNSIKVKVVPHKYWTMVYLYGTLDLAGELARV